MWVTRFESSRLFTHWLVLSRPLQGHRFHGEWPKEETCHESHSTPSCIDNDLGCSGSVRVGSEHLGPYRRSCPSCSEYLVHSSQCESLKEHELVGRRVLHHLH